MASNMRVVLFGRTGDGKSTVANALVTGGITHVKFPYSDGAEGCTSTIDTHTGRGWTVTDTIGLGEARTGTVSSIEAQDKLTKFLKEVKGDYSHIIFVTKANRVTSTDELNFLLFRKTFEGAEDAFVILFTSADEKWLTDNKELLPEYMKGIKTLAVNIPPVSDRPHTEKYNTEVRETSIRKLEGDLADIFDKRGHVYSSPNISRMDERELHEESGAFMEYVVECIKVMFDPKMWHSVASEISSIIDLANLADLVENWNQ